VLDVFLDVRISRDRSRGGGLSRKVCNVHV
jgi:hypothetical protein